MEQRISRTNLYDSLNRIKQVTTKAGDIQKNHYEYDAFGNATVAEKSVSNRFGFCGEIRDAVTGQYYLRARFYNPVVARFMSEDTYYGDGLNLYAYYHNNPVGWIDPSGHEGICAKKYGELSEKYKNDPKSLTQNEIQQMRDYEAMNGKTSYGKSSHNLEKTKGWKVGDPIDNLTKAGNEPSWNTVKKRYWKNEAYYNGELYSE